MKMDDDCRRTSERLTSYVDELLSRAEQADVERHLASCPLCRTAAEHERGARTVLRERAPALTDTPLPPGLRTRCEALARTHAGRSTTPAFRRLAMPAGAVAAVIVGLVAFSAVTHRSDTLLAAQLTADHAKCFRFSAGPNSTDADARRVEQMLMDRYGWQVHLPPSSPADGVRLLGARRCLYADGWVPHVMYRVDGHDVSLYVLDGVARSDADIISLGHRSRIWARDGTTYALVWPASAGEMQTAVRYVMEEVR